MLIRTFVIKYELILKNLFYKTYCQGSTPYNTVLKWNLIENAVKRGFFNFKLTNTSLSYFPLNVFNQFIVCKSKLKKSHHSLATILRDISVLASFSQEIYQRFHELKYVKHTSCSSSYQIATYLTYAYYTKIKLIKK